MECNQCIIIALTHTYCNSPAGDQSVMAVKAYAFFQGAALVCQTPNTQSLPPTATPSPHTPGTSKCFWKNKKASTLPCMAD